MKPWEFQITCPEDLPVFADVLEEWGHSGHEIVRHLINRGKFPLKSEKDETATWSILWKGAHEEGFKEYWYMVPGALAEDNHIHRFYSITEAIWAVINAGKYLPEKSVEKKQEQLPKKPTKEDLRKESKIR